MCVRVRVSVRVRVRVSKVLECCNPQMVRFAGRKKNTPSAVTSLTSSSRPLLWRPECCLEIVFHAPCLQTILSGFKPAEEGFVTVTIRYK